VDETIVADDETSLTISQVGIKEELLTDDNPRFRPPGKDPIWARLFVVVGVLLLFGSTGVLGAERLLTARVQQAVHQETLLAPQARTSEGTDDRASTVTGPLNFLLIGSDAREDDPENGSRSDTTVVLHIPASMDKAYLVSVPRDLRVQIPELDEVGFGGSFEKINGAFGYGGGGAGGVRLLSQTLSDLMGIRFNGAAIIDFGGFKKVVDQLGGVELCVDVRTESIHIGFDAEGKFLAPRTGSEGEYYNPLSTPKVYEPGCWHFTGWEALDYVRQRKTLPNGDYDRQRHQQDFLRAVLAKIRDQGLVDNPLALDRLVQAVGESLTIDTNGVPIDEVAYALRRVDPGALVGMTVPSEPQMIGGISYVVAVPAATDLYRALRGDDLDAWIAANPTWTNNV
jgi:LCP family protein required for cell wall assembly